ncbi:MAG: 3'-5' exonuclease [Sphaerochaetaceae bacterium]
MRQETKDKKTFIDPIFRGVQVPIRAAAEKSGDVRPPVNVMIDIETLGQGPDACVAEIGAVAVIGGLERLLDINVSLSSAIEAGGRIDPETVQWWLLRDADARRTMADNYHRAAIGEALRDLADFIHAARDACGGVRVWSCGSDLDLVILAGYYRRIGEEIPWKYWESRDYRTLRAMFPEVKKPKAEPAHTAIQDAMDQMDHLNMLLAHIDSLKAPRK